MRHSDYDEMMESQSSNGEADREEEESEEEEVKGRDDTYVAADNMVEERKEEEEESDIIYTDSGSESEMHSVVKFSISCDICGRESNNLVGPFRKKNTFEV